ncbi:MAG: ribonuclease Y [Planctomycetota bacterium]|jgi:ribonuclease Y|nr:ribonuclease Y [Planctomycetota bacterium]
MVIFTYFLLILLGSLLGGFIRHLYGKRRISSAENVAQALIKSGADAAEKLRIEAENLKQEAAVRMKTELFSAREKLENDIKSERNELRQTEKRLLKREDNLDRKNTILDEKEAQLRLQEDRLENRVSEIAIRESELESAASQQQEALFRISQLSPEEARKEVLEATTLELDHEIAVMVERANVRAKETADDVARKYISTALNRLAVDYTTEHVVSTVELPSDEMKGRIIGREGRNIRAFENATGVDVIVDDTPGVVVLSGFEPIRREVAVRTMKKLVSDGRIHPSRIEEMVLKTRDEMEKIVEETGKAVALELDVRNLKPREIMLLGRLKFRMSYGQNVLDHSREVGFLSGIIAAELGMDEILARRCGLLHDIGKAVDHEEEGTHPELGGEIARRCGEPEEVINAVVSHHSDTAAESLYATIVQAADAISAGRPGARRETLEKYVKRLERLEAISNSYPNVERSFAIQAGRELRVIAKADKVTDGEAAKMCREIAKQIETELTYPGEVKVTLVRELRITEYAR